MRFLLLSSALFLLSGCVRVDTSDDNGVATSSVPSSSVSSSSSSRVSLNMTGFDFRIPDGFLFERFAENLPGARVIVRDSFDNYWVSQPSEGKVTILEMSGSTLRNQYAGIQDLDRPHGLAFDPENELDLYIATETKLVKARVYSDAPLETIATWNGGGRHTSRTIGFGPDGRVYVSIGSSCDVCVESNEERGTIISMRKDGSDRRIVAEGLRNSVFFTWKGQELWATDMGRDNLGDNLPPEEVNIVRNGEHYGWPFCYGDQVRDQTFQPNTAFDCANTVPPKIKMPAHIAPLGLTFVPSSWPSEYQDDLLVAQHGSWNSTVDVGYKIVRIPLSANGTQEGEPQDFLTGFLQEDGEVLARPVELVIDEDDSLLLTDDEGGRVYRLRRFP